MQDKEHMTYNKDFVDQHWTKLSERLDEVKPVVTSNSINNKLILLLSGLLLIVSGFATFFAYKYTSHIPSTILTKEKIIYKDRISHAPLHETKQIAKKLSSTETPTSYLKSSEKPSLSVTYFYDEDELHFDLQSHSNKELASAPIFDNTKPLDYIDRLVIDQVNMSHTPNEPYIVNGNSDNQESLTEKRNLDFHVGMQAVISSDKDFTGIGFNTGIDIPVGKRFGITTGLGVNVMSREHYFISPIERAPASGDLPPNVALASPVPLGTDTYYNGLNTIKQVYLPVSVNYNLSNRIAFNSGVRVRYTYSENIDNNLPEPVTRRVPITPEVSESIFSDTNLGVSAGVSVRLNPHFSILLDGEWGVSQLISDPFIPNFGTQPSLNLLNLTTSYKF